MLEAKLYPWAETQLAADGPYVSDQPSTEDDPLCGYTYTPLACRFFAIDPQGHANYADGAHVMIDQIFEMRVFSKTWEWRWLRDGQSARMSMVSDEPLHRGGFKTPSRDPVSVLKRTGQQLLWGKGVDGAPHGWTRLTSQRIGSIDVPFQSEGTGRLALTTTEYFRQDPATGNWVFMTSRLSGFAAA